MERPLIWPWGTFVGFGALSFLLTSSISLGVVLGLAAAVTVWLATTNVAAEFRTRIAESLGVGPAQVDLEATVRSSSRAAAHLELVRDALNQLPNGILITAADGTVLAANTALTRLVPARAGEQLRDPNLLDAIASGSATVKLSGQSDLLTVSVAGRSALVLGR
jgi:PAS domain-containing protein